MGDPLTCSLRLELLGPLRVNIAGQNLPIECWKSRKALLLLKYLATRYGEKTPSDVLIDFLWPDNEFETSMHNLHTTMYFLRKTLKDQTPEHLPCGEWILFSNGLYWLDTSGSVSVDVQDFFDLCRESEHTEQTEPAKSLEIGLRALELCRGKFLPEDPYAEWAESARENCRNKYVDLALRTGRLMIDLRGDHRGTAKLCRETLEQDPYREELHQLLMRCLAAMGRLPEAIFQYNAYAKMLRDELDLEPNGKTKALLEEIKRNHKGLAVPASPGTDSVMICEQAAFRTIVSLEQRRLERTKRPMTLLTIALDEMSTTRHLNDVLAAVTKSMRKSDVVTQWSKGLLTILLSETDQTGAGVVERRIRNRLSVDIASRCCFNSQLLSPGDEVLSTLDSMVPAQITSH